MTTPGTVPAPVAPTIASLVITPIRGSVDYEGAIMGGAALTIDYELEPSAYALLQFETQRRTPKTLRTLEFKFQEQIRDSAVKKFDGKLEVANKAKEYNQEKFCEEVKNGIQYYGFQPFFYGPSQTDATTMINYVEDRHLVDLATVLQEHTSRLVKPPVVQDPITGNETQESALARQKCYDSYEQRDMALTRLYIRSLLTDTFYETVKARHLTMGHDFERIPGQVLFMMVMDACHASIERDFEGARKALSDMTLAQFPGEDVSAFAMHAQKKILILMSDFALPIDLGSSLVSKVMQTESPVFNSLVMDHYKKVKSMEKKYAGKNPTLLTADSDYKEFGPIGSMEYLQNEHGTLLGENNWPATARQLPATPSGNATGDVDIASSTGTKHGQGTRPVPAYIKCHCCGENHYKRDCPCDKCKAKRAPGGAAQGGGGGRGRGGGRGTQGGRGQSTDRSWRLVEPADKTKPYIQG